MRLLRHHADDPQADSEKKANLFNRANRLRMNAEFDRAASVYASITAEFPEEAEAYWGLCLCKYGIEYVDDPATGNKIPTCHRTLSASILDDEDFIQACENADPVAKRVYRDEAKAIDRLQQDILSIVANEAPYDVFICYNETDANGRRTPDSVLATELYHLLTKEGFKVFLSRITLEDKIGSAYEPYIFAALNSAKVMVALGTRPEYFNAVWVKNEWSRYLALIRAGADKTLVPAYRDMDPYDLPKEFAHLQAQDMGKLGFMQDLIHGIKKLAAKEEAKPQPAARQTAPAASSGANKENLMKRARLFMEDGDFKSANEYLDKVLDEDAECAPAYVGKVCTSLGFRREADLGKATFLYADHPDWKKAMRFADPRQKAAYEGYLSQTKARVQEQIRQYAYDCAVEMAVNPQARQEALEQELAQYKQACGAWEDGRADGSRRQLAAKREAQLWQAAEKNDPGSVSEAQYLAAADMFRAIGDGESLAQAECCEALAQQARMLGKQAAQAAGKKRRTAVLLASVAVLAIAAVFAVDKIILPKSHYDKGVSLRAQQKWDEAIAEFEQAGDYSDAKTQLAKILEQTGKKAFAALAYSKAGDRDKAIALWHEAGKASLAAGEFHTVGLKADGTVVYGECEVSGWTDIVAVAAGGWHIVGLKADGTVVAAGRNSDGECNVSGWTDIVAMAAGYDFTVGLKADGTVVAAGENVFGQCNVSGWTDIVAVAAGGCHTVGLKADGTVVAVGYNEVGQCDVSGWTDIVAVAAGYDHTVGLKADGTVVAVGDNRYGQCDVSGLTDIVAVAAGGYHTVGLKADGTVVAVGYNEVGQCDVSGWTDIVAVAAGSSHTVGLKADGTVAAVGDNRYGQCDVSGWINIKIPW